MPDSQRGTDRIGRRAKRFLSPSQKYEIWLQLVRQETTISEAADRFEVDRSTIMRIREVARQGALEALATSKPGVQPTKRDWSWRPPMPRRPGWGRPSRSWPSSCCWWREKGVGAEWPGPAAGGCGHQGRPAGLARGCRRPGLDGAGGVRGAGAGPTARVAGSRPPSARRWSTRG
jgi:transposase